MADDTSQAIVQAATIQAAAQVQAATAAGEANIEAAFQAMQGQIAAASTAAGGTAGAAAAHAEGMVSAAGTQASATIGAAQAHAGAVTAAAASQASATTAAASSEASATIGAAQAHAGAVTGAATAQAAAHTAAAIAQADATKGAAEAQAEGHVGAAEAQASGHVGAAAAEAGGRIQAAQTQRDAVEYEADRHLDEARATQDGEMTRLVVKLQYASGVIDKMWPIIQDVTSTDTTGGTADVHPPAPAMAARAFAAPAGALADIAGNPTTPGLPWRTPPPYISARPVLTPAQIQQQVNAVYAKNDARAVSQVRQSAGELAGRGFAASSPLLESIRVGFVGQAMQASVAAAAQLRLGAAQTNLDMLHRGQELRNTQYSQQQGVALESQKNAITRQVGILGAVAQMIAGIV